MSISAPGRRSSLAMLVGLIVMVLALITLSAQTTAQAREVSCKSTTVAKPKHGERCQKPTSKGKSKSKSKPHAAKLKRKHAKKRASNRNRSTSSGGPSTECEEASDASGSSEASSACEASSEAACPANSETCEASAEASCAETSEANASSETGAPNCEAADNDE